MVKFEFYLSDEDYNRLYAIKKKRDRDYLDGNEFARELLKRELYRLHPHVPEFDENGDELVKE